MQKESIITISANHPSYPTDFKHLAQPPSIIYAQGNLELLFSNTTLGIIGTRRPTTYGLDATELLIKMLRNTQTVIVSGLALGIDAQAHKVALRHGLPTIAVLPSSLHSVYPATNTYLARQILAQGGLLVSEYPNLEKPNKYQFIERNRLVAGLSKAILIPEAAAQSGTRHTVRFAQELGRNIGFVPGPITSPASEYTNYEIKNGGAPINDRRDLADLLPFNISAIGEFSTTPKGSNAEEQAILDALSRESLTHSQLLAATHLDASAYGIHTTMLEIKGVIERTTNNQWRLAK